MKPPIFVLGNPRSGTTLLRLMLASHPNVVIPPECGFAIWLEARFGDWSADDSVDVSRVAGFIGELQKCRKFDTWQIDSDVLRNRIQAVPPASYSALVESVYQTYWEASKPSAKRWGDKNNFHMQHVVDLYRLFPEVQFIHIVRDVRDVACSYRELQLLKSDSPYAPQLPTSARDIAVQWRSNLRCLLDSEDRLPHNLIFHLRYEDLVFAPSESVKAVCRHLRESFQPVMLEFYRFNRQSRLEPPETMDWKMKTLKPIDVAGVGKYKECLSSDDVRAIETIAGAELQHFGYLKS